MSAAEDERTADRRSFLETLFPNGGVIDVRIPGAEMEATLRFRGARDGSKPKPSGYCVLTVSKALAHAEKCRADRRSEREAEAAQEPAGGEVIPFRPEALPEGPDPLEDKTDDGLARRFLRLHGDDVLRVPAWRRWIVWDGRRFVLDSLEATRARGRMKRTALSIYSEIAVEENPERRDQLLQRAEAGRSKAKLHNALSMVEIEVPVEIDELDAAVARQERRQ